ncbi:fatty acid desaturase [uncultured Azohydromonas sp.]|jgi:Fatty acid desaturase|uniref:fatty acid desaturase n=1 Tax=uncultured Azohydromonas sp. TaxID=487342 RepID=UPI0026142F37|nr:fatty acid desaturase [uncultured Azohydromonas sp.]
MVTANAVLNDLTAFRSELQKQQIPYQHLLKLAWWRPLCDVAVDLLVVALAVAAVVYGSWWLAPLALVVIANRQRALGNILHDAAHRNLHRKRLVNDGITNALIAPLVFADLTAYRDTHFEHHLQLGHPSRDPDYLARLPGCQVSPLRNYARLAFSLRQWRGSIAGHLENSKVPLSRRLYIVGWWIVFAGLIHAAVGPKCLAAFLMLWILARATAFHLITMFREMCDHFGFTGTGVLSFTRDIVHGNAWYLLIHPRNNGYHLTHHLLPAVPYYNLPAAQKLFAEVPLYRQKGNVFKSYLLGPTPVASGWQTHG